MKIKLKKIRKLLKKSEGLELYKGPEKLMEFPEIWSVDPVAVLYGYRNTSERFTKKEFFDYEELERFLKKRARKRKVKL